MSKRFTFFALALLSLTTFLSCSEEETVNEPGICGTIWADEVEQEINDLTLATQAYTDDPSAENCAAYKAALQEYVDALEPYGECTTLTGQQRANWEAAVAEAEASIEDIEC